MWIFIGILTVLSINNQNEFQKSKQQLTSFNCDAYRHFRSYIYKNKERVFIQKEHFIKLKIIEIFFHLNYHHF